MRYTILIFVYLLFSITTFSQKSVKDVFYSHQFACDSNTTQLELNICSGEKAEYVDSLMNRLYKRIILFLDSEIKKNTRIITDHRRDSSDRKFAEMERKYYTSTKLALLKSQKTWESYREADCELERVGCETGSACNTIVNNRFLKITLARIEAFEEFDLMH